MLNKSTTLLAVLAALMASVQPASSASGPASGIYQIVSGRYVACCGIAGPFSSSLPDAGNAFIELTVDSGNNLAQMRFLGQDLRTVLRIPPRSEERRVGKECRSRWSP